jgi:methionyl-tRNA formyltransferase
MKICIASKITGHTKNLVKILREKYKENVVYIPQELCDDSPLRFKYLLEKHKPDWIFFFHWSKIIPEEIFENYKCVTIHTSNLPDGRGGHPIQNQILDNIKFTRVNAICTTDKIDAGDIYCYREISLQGSLNDIWDSITYAAAELIEHCVENNPIPTTQDIPTYTYKRRKDNQVILKNKSLYQLYDQIRMLDGDNYPSAFIQIDNFVFNFTRAKCDGEEILCDVRIKQYES